jgi:hypothetical protein
MELGINLIIALLILGMTYALSSEGLWGACLMFFNVVFGGLIAFNFYEPLAKLLAENVPFLAGHADSICLLGLFLVATLLLRLTTETLAPAMVRFPTPIYHLGRLGFGLACGALTVAILLLGFETAAVHKKVFGVIDYKALVPFGMGIERQWLAFFQYTTGQVFVTHTPDSRDPFDQYGDAKVFDPRAEWLLLHEEARPYGDESILSEGQGGEAAPGGGGQGGAAPGGGGVPGGAAPGGATNSSDVKVIGPAVGGGVVIPN